MQTTIYPYHYYQLVTRFTNKLMILFVMATDTYTSSHRKIKSLATLQSLTINSDV